MKIPFKYIGQIFVSAAVSEMTKTDDSVYKLLSRFMSGDWGNISRIKRKTNQMEIKTNNKNGCILACYDCHKGKIFIVNRDKQATFIFFDYEIDKVMKSEKLNIFYSLS